jgi:hypothetical protein
MIENKSIMIGDGSNFHRIASLFTMTSACFVTASGAKQSNIQQCSELRIFNSFTPVKNMADFFDLST